MQTESMKRLYFHIFMWVLVAVCLGSVVSLKMVTMAAESDEAEDNRWLITNAHPIISAELLDVPRSQWRSVLDKWESITWYQLDFTAIDGPIWEGEDRVKPDGDQLAFSFHGTIFTDYLEASRRISGTDQVLLYSMTDPWSIEYQVAYYVGQLIILISIAGVSFYVVKPIYRSTKKLSLAARRYAQGELDARIDVDASGPFEEVSHQFNRMAEHIQHKIHEQEVMTHSISHELKTPITRLRLAVDMAAATQNTEDLRDLLTEMDHDINELDVLTAQILSLARLTYSQDTLPLERLALLDIIQEEASKIQDFNPDVKITLSGDTNLHCFGHEDHLSRIFHNLLINGQRYANKAVHVDLRSEGEAILINVDDDGAGIPEDQRELIFLPFARLDSSRTRQTGGYGLGLAIVRQSVEQQRGSIVAEGSPIGGARFALRFHKA
jgi:two-component system sensor histidine kinase RstB